VRSFPLRPATDGEQPVIAFRFQIITDKKIFILDGAAQTRDGSDVDKKAVYPLGYTACWSWWKFTLNFDRQT
jgi:hypothetical protein